MQVPTTNKRMTGVMLLIMVTAALVLVSAFCLLPSFNMALEKHRTNAAEDSQLIVTEADLAYTSVSGGVSITGLSPLFKATNPKHDNLVLTIPATNTNGDAIVEIGSNAFRRDATTYNTNYDFVALNVSSATNLKTIANFAFSGCSSLSAITLPNGLTTIGTSAFSSCVGLTAISFPSSLANIEQQAFQNSGLTGAILSHTSITTLPQQAFNGCSNLMSLSLPGGLTTIEMRALYGCTKLASVILPSTLEDIGNQAFQNSGLKNIDLSYTLITIIPQQAFFGCSSLTSIALPTALTSIRGSAFHGCSSLTNITLPNGLNSIGQQAFQNSGLVSVDLSNTLITIIPQQAFSGCGELLDITLPNDLTTLEAWAFQNSGLTSVDLSDTLITDIPQQIFSGCTSLANISLPSGLTTINICGFENSGLISIDLSHTLVTTITQQAFAGCARLASVFLPSGLASIEGNAFLNCGSLAEIELLGNISIATVGTNAFGGTTPSSLLIIVDEAIYPTYYSGAFSLSGAEQLAYYIRLKPTFADETLWEPNLPNLAALEEAIEEMSEIYLRTIKQVENSTTSYIAENVPLVISDYTLNYASGKTALEAGTNTITLTNGRRICTFDIFINATDISSISVSFSQNDEKIYSSLASLDSLKPKLTVTATHNDTSESVLEAGDYTLSGTIADVSSEQTITVKCDASSTTFTVNITAIALASLSVSFIAGDQPEASINTTLWQLKSMLKVVAINNDGTSFNVAFEDFTVDNINLVSGKNTLKVKYGAVSSTIEIEVTDNISPIVMSILIAAGILVVLMIVFAIATNVRRRKR